MPTTALLSFTHPSSSSSSQTTILNHLSNASKEYYSTPPSQVTTYTYFTLSTRPKNFYAQLTPSFPPPLPKPAPKPKAQAGQDGSAAVAKGNVAAPTPTPTEGDLATPANNRLVIGELQLLTSKSGLTKQTEQSWFKDFQSSAEKGGWFDRGKANGKGEEMSLWGPVGGFIARGGREGGRKGNIVMLAVFECKDHEKSVVEAGKVLSDFAAWVQANEPGTLSYLVLARPASKKSNELIMFERYESAQALGVHGAGKEFKAMFKKIVPFIDPRKTKICEFEEEEGSFVGEGSGGESKL